jgi:spore coat polysaccharide biosynthesis protein SpsF (cytidylyltransferase family)
LKTAVIICSRTDSERLPGKVFRKIHGLPLIEHLIKRLEKTQLSIVIAVPNKQVDDYIYLAKKYSHVRVYSDDEYDCPLNRMYNAAVQYNIQNVVRITHDKVFVDSDELFHAIDIFNKKNLDYLYSSSICAGTGFEIISRDALKRAARKFKGVEFLSYAIREVTKNQHDLVYKDRGKNLRFLIDYKEDLDLLELLFAHLGISCSKKQAIQFLNDNPQFQQINPQPILTVYTCAYNADKWLDVCMASVAKQKYFKRYEYLLIDDCSSDSTYYKMAEFALKYPNVRCIRNGQNIGLSSSSNVALKAAKGKYIFRLDADDWLVSDLGVHELVREMDSTGNEIIYPNYYLGGLGTVISGKKDHHVGCAMFDKRALNHLKFTEGLRGHDSLDIFVRAQNSLKIGYLNRPVFFYRQHPESLTKNNLKEREEIKKRILNEAENRPPKIVC